MRPLLVLVALALLAGCAAMKQTTGFASWDHLAFSAKSNWQIFHYWEAKATRGDAETARRQGGWWGDEVPVVE